jgi:hypothetical protein
MFVRELFQKCLCGLMLGWAMTAPMPVVAGEGAAVNLRDSPAKATTARNIKVVEEFRANEGKVGGRSNLLLLHTAGAITG